MAINTYRFWMATDTNRLLANQTSFIQASPPAFYQGNVANLELYMVASAGVGVTPIEIPFPAGSQVSVAVGDTNTYPTGGTWELMVDTTETEAMPYNATTAQVAAALNAITEVSSAGGVSVSKTGDGYTITWNTYGLKPSIGIGSDTLTPSSYESISLVQEGSAERRQIVFVELRQNPIALSNVWTPLPTPSITSTLVKAWDGSSVIWRVTIYPQPKAGTMTLSYGTKTATIDVVSSATTIAIALEAQVFATGQYQWDIVLAEDSTLTASGNLIGYNGYSGTINFATAECHQFLAGAESKNTILEVSISVDDKRYTLIQTSCQVRADVVSDGVITPLPLGVALSEQVANARFVRRDIDQNPDTATQDIIWQNLGVETLGSDVAGALNGADSPSAANPFVTLSDISGLGATWGNITGTLSDQTDLQTALDNKYDASNPSGYIPEANVDGNLYGRKNGAWELVPSLDGYATESWVTSQGYLTSADLAGYATESWVAGQGYTTESWVNSQGFITSGAIGDMATMTWVYEQNYTTLEAAQSWTQAQGYLTFDSYGRLSFAGGYNPDPSPIAGRLWFQSDKFRYSTSTAQLNALASEGFVAGMLSSYAPLAGASFTGKVNTPASNTSVAGFNIAPGVAPTTPVNGDVWITTGLWFRNNAGTNCVAALSGFTNTFSAPQIVDTTATTAALRVTQKGTGNAIEVEDSTTPDATRFVVDQFGKVGVGVAPDATAAIKVDANGISFNGLVFNPTATSAHSGGTDTLDLLVTINGTNYRIGLRPA